MKKCLATLMAAFIVIGVTGCGSSGSSSANSERSSSNTWQSEEESSEIEENSITEEDIDETRLVYDEETGIYTSVDSDSVRVEDTGISENQNDNISPAVSLRNQVFVKVSPFSEERAWVQYLSGDGEIVTSVINTNGEIVFTLDRKADYYYDFHDGFAYYLYTPDPTREREENLDNVAVCIVDRDGNITYDSQNDSIRAILSYGDGQFLAIEHISTFDIDEWRFGSIDKDGNTLTEFETYDTNKIVYLPIYRSTYDGGYFDQYFRYLDEGMFYLYSANSGRLYNVRERKIISDSVGTVTKVGHYQNGHMLYSGGGNSWGVWIYDTDGNRNDIEMRTHSNFDRSEIFLSGFSENMCFYDHAYYDSDANVKIDLSRYEDKKIAGGMFNQGYAPLYIEGADGKNYFTIIDSQGNEVFSPILGSPTSSFGEGLLIVQLESGCALFNTAGEKVLETSYKVAGTMAYEEHSLMDWTANHSPYAVSDGYFIACKDGSSVPTVFVGVDGSYIGQ